MIVDMIVGKAAAHQRPVAPVDALAIEVQAVADLLARPQDFRRLHRPLSIILLGLIA
jgi:hypothetical protein